MAIASSPDEHSPASSLSRSYSAPAKIKTAEEDSNPDKPSFIRDNFLTRTILAPILFLSFILSLAIVDRKRRLEEDRKHGVLTKRQRLLYFWLYWEVPRTPKNGRLRSATEPCLSRTSALEHDSDSGDGSSRRGSGYSEDCGERDEAKILEIKTLAEKRREARSLSAEAFSIQNRVLLGMGAFSIGFGLLCWATYLKFKQLLGFI
ncbi:hypothetical protein TWF481_003846 [Arthrobotrys musiformis]|uniref:Uncharacterized protein n=1 Tax=Arthrobotrys musiformis TaxID=47236 RepID=A0AAV9WNK2_9PEZI